MSLAVLAEVVAVAAPWWTDTHHRGGVGEAAAVGDIEVSLWDVRVTSVNGKFESATFSWEDYCTNYAKSESWCHKIRTVRALTFLAIGTGILSIACFGAIAVLDHRWGGRALASTLLSMCCAVTAFGVSTFFPTEGRPAVDTPAFGFVMMCWAAGIAFVTAIMCFFGMRYNLTPDSKALSVTFGKACVIAAGSLALISTVMQFIAVFAPWWKDNHVHIRPEQTVETSIVATLWRIELTSVKGIFEPLDISWEEYCSEKYINSETWCHKIRSVRATLILAIVLGISSHVLFGISAFKERQGFGSTAIATSFFGMVCSICAFSVSLFYATDTEPAVNTPGFGFIIVCLASLMTLLSVPLASYGLWYNPYSGFKLVESEGSRDWKLDGAATAPQVVTESV